MYMAIYVSTGINVSGRPDPYIINKGEVMSRVQLALTVSNADEAATFYGRLFGAEPAKRRPGYVNFTLVDPPLKLVLIEGDAGGTLNHLGVEVESTDMVFEAAQRLDEIGLETRAEDDVECCYARQDKVWVTDPDGAPWEIYTVIEDSAVMAPVDDSCCGTSSTSNCCAPTLV